MAYRLDIGSLRPARKLADGRLRADGYLTRTGVFVYRNPDGTERRELRLPDEVFRSDSLDTFDTVIVTDDHPPEPVTARNARAYTVGTVLRPRRDGEYVAAEIVVHDDEVIRKMQAGKVQLSCGYECDLEERSGEHNGERYDAIQRNIRGNHVAIVESGRAGNTARVRMDAAVMTTTKEMRMQTKEDTNGTEIKEAYSQLAAVKVRADKAESQLTEVQRRLDAALGEAESLRVEKTRLTSEKDQLLAEIKESKERWDKADISTLKDTVQQLTVALEDERRRRVDAEDPARIREAARARVKLESRAHAAVGSGFKFDAMSDRDVQVTVIDRLQGVKLGSEHSDDYVRARFDSAVEGYHVTEEQISRVRRDVAAAVKSADPRQQMIERNRAASNQTAQKDR